MNLRIDNRYDLHWGVNGVEHFLDKDNILNKFLPFVHEVALLYCESVNVFPTFLDENLDQVFGGAHMTKMDFNGLDTVTTLPPDKCLQNQGV